MGESPGFTTQIIKVSKDKLISNFMLRLERTNRSFSSTGTQPNTTLTTSSSRVNSMVSDSMLCVSMKGKLVLNIPYAVVLMLVENNQQLLNIVSFPRNVRFN